MAIGDLQTTQTIELGRQGENLATTLEFDLLELYHEYAVGKNFKAVLIHKRPGDARPYIAAESENSYKIEWDLGTEDTAKSGVGQAEIRFYVGELLKKSALFSTTIIASLMDGEAEKPGSIVYMTAVASDMAGRISSIESMSPLVIASVNKTDYMIAGADEITQTYNGKKGYEYRFNASSISTGAGVTPNLTMKLMNGTSSAGQVTINAAGSTFDVTATSDFDRIVIVPNVDINSINFKLYEESPITGKVTGSDAEITQLKQNILELKAGSGSGSSGSSGTGITATAADLLCNILLQCVTNGNQSANIGALRTILKPSSSGGSGSGSGSDSGGSGSGTETAEITAAQSGTTVTISGFVATPSWTTGG